ncbi:Putative zn(2)-C6 fungal-type DNA-binding domain superfamily [Colletotrichum destructivum]|uniref:Zn(2)-C6 fungal-type DNA-binding domain superfamily n=1 Tax=Colletotrichum destructivum TaxID=34406 RepID=A0AAX4J4W2_9PEZI|nr:Putative zn(2)-C6 fungal-type DNA-binding domain superfamily [Colletotrichum destructivum]
MKAFTKSQCGRSIWHLSSNLEHEVRSISPLRSSGTPFHGPLLSKPGPHETIPSNYRHDFPLESIGEVVELEGGSAFTPHSSKAPKEQQHTADMPGIEFHLPSSVVCFPCLLSNNLQCDGQSPACLQCLQSGLTCEEQVPFLAAGEMFLKALP